MEAMSSDAKLTWIGHATALIEMGGQRILTDPLGRSRTRDAQADTILITHAHVDHLNRWTLSRLPRDAHVILPKGAGRYIADLKFSKVTEVEPGDQLSIGHIDICAVDTRHDPGRWRKGDGPINAGYVVSGGGLQVHHAGDVDFSDFSVFEDIGQRFDIDVSLLPIGGMLPVWWYRWRKSSLDNGIHIDPDTALTLAERLGARCMVPIHWGTVHLRFGPPSAPKKRLEAVAASAGKSDLVEIMEHGGSLTLTNQGGI
jgi:L-ascorbate metabolism protein UlaG (beta-lactamase superfamily)